MLQIPLETCSGMLDHDLDNNLLEYGRNLVTETRSSPKNSLNQSFVVEELHVEGFQSPELSWQFVDDEEGEGEVLSYYNNNSVGSNDCISENIVSVPSDDDSRYQRLLSNIIFNNTQRLILGSRFRGCHLKESAFVSWKSYDDGILAWKEGGSSQTLVKKALYQVPKMHHRSHSCNDIDTRFSVLRSLLPCRKGKVDRVSVLDDTIDYLKELERKVEALERRKHTGDHTDREIEKKCRGCKRKGCWDAEEERQRGGVCGWDRMTVTAVEKEVRIEIRCGWRENMMVEVLDALSSLSLEAQSVQSSTVDGVLTLSIESKMVRRSCTSMTGEMVRQALERVMGG